MFASPSTALISRGCSTECQDISTSQHGRSNAKCRRYSRRLGKTRGTVVGCEGLAETQPHNLGIRGWLDKVGSVGKTSRLRELFPSAREAGDTSSDGSAVSARLDMLGNV